MLTGTQIRLLRLSAEIDQQIAEVIYRNAEPMDSDSVQRATATLCDLYDTRSDVDRLLKVAGDGT
jgi:hypothetical protein